MSEENKVMKMINTFKNFQRKLESDTKQSKRDFLVNEARRYNIPDQQIPEYIEKNINQLETVESLADVSGGVKKLTSKVIPEVAKNMSKKMAEGILNKYNTDEIATNLVGAERKNYLDALTEIYGPRNQRSKDMGFGNKTWYHGTSVPIEKFEDTAKGLSTGAQSAKKGFFFAKDPSTASDYAELAKEKGVIREGDKVTTRYLSEKADISNDLYDQQKSLNFDINESKNLIQRAKERLLNTKEVLGYRLESLKNNSWPKGLTKEDILEDIKRSQDKIAREEQFIIDNNNKINNYTKEFKNISDLSESGGQNVVPVRLKGNPHVKDYKGEAYRDTTYADEMTKAQEKNADSVLFKNTYDPADPANRVKQDIAAVFNPNQIRSVNAAFDPRFKDSNNILAGASAAPLASETMSEESDSYPNLLNFLKGKK